MVFCSLAGDFGFDPLGLGEDPENLRWYVQAELVHARFAMAGVAGILVTDVSISASSLDFVFLLLFPFSFWMSYKNFSHKNAMSSNKTSYSFLPSGFLE